MRPLYKIFYENNREDFKDIYLKRYTSDATVRLGLHIKPIDQSEIFELYYVPTNNMLNKISQIYKVSSDLQFIFEKLPDVAKDHFIYGCLVEELYNTNELEGVRSSKEEIARSVKEIRLNKKDKKRFNSMIKSYLNLINKETNLPLTPIEIRKIYDDITEGEIDNDELPDGEIFRKDITYIISRSGSGKVIHRGLKPESKIISEVENMLKLMNEYKEIPLIIRAAIGHYFFGYIHPFYDGNGRTSRFISSLYLAKALGEISALSLSRGCNKFTTRYLDSFIHTSGIMNHGEMNIFIGTFLEIILNTLKDMYSELREKVELLDSAVEKLNDDIKLKGKNQYNFMFVLAQNHFFHFSDGVPVNDLSITLNLTATTVRKTAKELLDKGIIEQRGKKPAFYKVKQHYFES